MHTENNTFTDLQPNHQEGILVKLRKLQEHIYSQIREYYGETVMPESLTFSQLRNHLGGNIEKKRNPQTGKDEWKNTTKIYQEEPIGNLYKVVHKNTSCYIHYNKEHSGFYTQYGFKAIAFSLFEIMMWYKNGIETGLFK